MHRTRPAPRRRRESSSSEFPRQSRKRQQIGHGRDLRNLQGRVAGTHLCGNHLGARVVGCSGTQQKEDQMSDYDPNLGPGRFGYDPRTFTARPTTAVPVAFCSPFWRASPWWVASSYFGNPQNSAPEQAQARSRRERTLDHDNPGAPAAADRPARPFQCRPTRRLRRPSPGARRRGK